MLINFRLIRLRVKKQRFLTSRVEERRGIRHLVGGKTNANFTQDKSCQLYIRRKGIVMKFMYKLEKQYALKIMRPTLTFKKKSNILKFSGTYI